MRLVQNGNLNGNEQGVLEGLFPFHCSSGTSDTNLN